MSDLGIFEHYPNCDMQFAPLDACNCSTKRIRELEAENAVLKRKLTTLEELGSSFAVLYPSKTEVQSMIENNK